MELFIKQLFAFALIVAFGFYLGRKEILTQESCAQLSRLLLSYVIPLSVMRAFLRPFVLQEALEMATVFGFAIVFTLFSIWLTGRVYKKGYEIDRYSVIFNNKAFIAVPLLQAVYGVESVFYAAPVIIVAFLFIYTYGQNMLNGKSGLTLSKVLKNPVIWATLLGFFFYFTGVPIPAMILRPLDSLLAINSPLAMILLGVFLSAGSLLAIFTERRAWVSAFLRLLVVPVLVVGVLAFFPFSTSFKEINTIIWACPSAMNLTMFTALAGKNTHLASKLVSLSTLLSVFTMPVVLWFASAVFR